MAELKLAFDAVKRGVNQFVLSAYSGGQLACELQVRLLKGKAILLPYPKAPFAAKQGFREKGVAKVLVAYAVGFSRKQGAHAVIFANFLDEKIARQLAGPGRVMQYHEFSYPQDPERYQIIWD